jgi:hypothetical protein
LWRTADDCSSERVSGWRLGVAQSFEK